MNAKLGKELEEIGFGAFRYCSLERITLPLKNVTIADDATFQGCLKLKSVDLVEMAILRNTVSALLLEEWKNDMNEEIDSINHTLPKAHNGPTVYVGGGKALEIRRWIRSLLHKVVHYRAEHERFLNEAATSLQLTLPRDILMNNVLTFLELPPPHSFEVEDSEEDEDEDNRDASYSEGSSSEGEESSYSERSSSEGEESGDV